MKTKRIEALQHNLKQKNITAAAILPSAGLYYLTGMTAGLSERPMLFVFMADGQSLGICPSFEAERVRRDSGVTNLFTYTDEEGAAYGFKRLFEAVGGISSVAMEYQAARLLEYTLLRDHCKVENLFDLRPILAEQRMAKDAEEINIMQQAANLADATMANVEANLKPGVTELEVVAAAQDFIKSQGARMSFISVIAGERSALPHASISGRAIELGDSVVVDLGCIVEGYTSDITRTFVMGSIDPEIEKIGQIVHEANQLAFKAVHPGVTAEYIDKAAREYIVSQGYGKYFTHRTGHGLGLEVHEEPYIVGGSNFELQVGHTFTIEPGIYLPGKGGVRIEDDVCVTATGAISFTKYPRAVKVIK